MQNTTLDNLLQKTRGKQIGLISTPASRIAPEVSLEDVLIQQGDIQAFLALEHGLRGELQDGITFDSYTDSRTGLPVFSFYDREKTVPKDFFDCIDVAVFCVQEISHRAYTFKQALAALLAGAEKYHTDVIVLDRPTPLAHLGVQGPVHAQFFPIPLPVIIPYTLGELGLFLVADQKMDVSLDVIPVQGWQRSDCWELPATPWIPPSPNIPSLTSAYAYAATGILQATNVSEGRGTCKPFEFFGAPFIKPTVLCNALQDRHLPGVEWREIFFKPEFNKYAGNVCGGLHIMITDPLQFAPVLTTLHILQALASLYPQQFKLEPGLPQWLDRISRSPETFASLNIPETAQLWQKQAKAFAEKIQPSLLYS